MSPPSPLPTPDDLRKRIDQSMLIDRRAFRSRLGTLQHEAEKGTNIAARVEQLAADIDASAARAEQRDKNAPVPTFANDLPITQRRDEIAKAIAEHQVTVVCGETGSGKTTQLPQICLALGRGRFGMIGHTQPRRIAARAVAQRIAEELGTSIAPKSPVGFKVRFGDQTGEATLVKLMTDGVLLAEASHDRDLLAYDTIIIDEAHERSLNIDFLLGYLKQLLPRRPDLKVIITSATIDPQRLSNHFGGPKVCPVIEVSGRTYPVEVRYHRVADIDEDDFEQNEEEALLEAVDELTTGGLPRGDILAFFPGEREIRLAAELLRKTYHQQFEILPLYARLSPQDQQRVFSPTKGGPTRIVLATNVAETSLTVPGIRYVIDTGLARISRYSHRTKVQRLPIEAISQASANQRSGRCGRVAAGVAIRLYTEEDFKTRPAFTEPEILRTNLASVILQMKSLRLGAVEEFPFVEPPDSRMIKDGYDTLLELGAITEEGNLTEIGRSLARLPLDPKLGRIIIAAEDQGCLTEVLPIAAALSVQDPRDRPMEKAQAADQAQSQFKHETSDFITLLNIWEWWNKARDSGTWNQVKKGCHDRFLSFNRMREWEETHNQLRRLCEELDFAFNDPKHKPAGDDSIHKALLPGLLSNILLKNEAAGAQAGEYKGARGVTAYIFPGSTLFKKNGRWLVAAELVQTTRLYARTLARVQPEWIEQAAAHLIKRSFSDPHFHDESGRVMAWERATLHGLPLITRRRADYGKINPTEARDIFIYDALVNRSYVPTYAEKANPDSPDGWFTHNTRVLADAERVEAKLRRHDLIAEKNAIHNFFDSRIDKPGGGEKGAITSTHQFEGWRKDASRKDPHILHMSLAQILPEGIAEEADDTLYPDYVPLGQSLGLLDYHLAPGKDKDGVTLNVPIETLTALDEHTAEWLVPGMVQDKVHALLKGLPKQYRTQFVGQKSAAATDGDTGLAALAAELTSHLTFQDGRMADALTRAADDLRGVAIPADAWPMRGIPDHLRLNVRVLDEQGNTLGEGRDIDELKKKFAGRARRSLSNLARQEFGKEGLTSWSWSEGDDPLPESVEIDRAGSTVVGYPCIQDTGDSVALTLADSPETAHRLTRRGLIRLFALQCKDEVLARLRSLPDGGADVMYRHYGAIGDPSELKRDLVDLVCEQTFLAPTLGEQPGTKNDFEVRLQTQWGRLGGNTITIGKLVATVLANRHRVAHKLASGYPKQWEISIADLREHAAWLLPPGVFHCVPLDRLQHYPRYTEGMWRRLERLREGGTAKEAQTFPQVTAAWKRFTHWVHTHHNEAKKQEEEAGLNPPAPSGGVGGGSATPGGAKGAGTTQKPRNVLPQAQGKKRARVVIATDAAAWAMQSIADAAMPPAVEQYRWLLEEFRVSAFAQELGTTQPVSAKRLDEAWLKVE